MELKEGAELSRPELYNHYQRFCERKGLEFVHQVAFGRLFRHFFPNLPLVRRPAGYGGGSERLFQGITYKIPSAIALLTEGAAKDAAQSDSDSSDQHN